MKVVFDLRWKGQHGIGRFASEVRRRFPIQTEDVMGDNPTSLKGILGLEWQLLRKRHLKDYLFLSPGYTPSLLWRGKMAFTIHDLIHIDVQEERSFFKDIYYKHFVKRAVKRAIYVFTVSEYSRHRIIEWSNVHPQKVVVVGNGVDSSFNPDGPKYDPGYPYIFYVSNTKPHKNVARLLEAFSKINSPNLHLLLSGEGNKDIRHLALCLGIYDRVIFTGRIPEKDLPNYYRGAAVVTMPSLYEGFGLPALEGMACGVPVVVSNTTSLPEVVGNAGILVNPYDPESITMGLTRGLTDEALRIELRQRGLERVKLFKWDNVAAEILERIEIADSKLSD